MPGVKMAILEKANLVMNINILSTCDVQDRKHFLYRKTLL